MLDTPPPQPAWAKQVDPRDLEFLRLWRMNLVSRRDQYLAHVSERKANYPNIVAAANALGPRSVTRWQAEGTTLRNEKLQWHLASGASWADAWSRHCDFNRWD